MLAKAPLNAPTAVLAAPADDWRPVAVSRAIAGLLRVLPVPDGPDVDDTARAAWFARKAALLDALASAAADPGLATEALHLAREARAAARTYLAAAVVAQRAQAALTRPLETSAGATGSCAATAVRNGDHS